MVQRQQTQAQFLIGRLDEPLKGVISSRDGQGGAAAQPGLRDHELSSPGPGRGLAAVSGQVGLVSGLAGKVPGRGRGLSRRRVWGRATRVRAGNGRGWRARRWTRRCHASGRRPVSQVQLGRHEAEVAQLQLVVHATLDRLPDVGG